MRYKTFIVVTALSALPVWAASSLEQMEMKIETISTLANTKEVSTAFNREMKYAKANFSMNQKVKAEVNLYASNLQKIIITAYEAELKDADGDAVEAKERILQFAETDLKNATPGIADDVRALTLETLENYEKGGFSANAELYNVAELVKDEVEFRADVLNDGGIDPQPKVNNSKDADKKSYATKEELLESLLSNRDSARWVSTSNQTLRTANASKRDAKMAVSVQIPFLGTTGLSSSVVFKRETTTGATIIAEGLEPFLLADGNFDYWKRDNKGNILVKNNVKQKRFASFTCDSERSFSNEASAGGSLSIGIPGLSTSAEKNWTRTYSSSVTMNSRRIALPEYVGGKTVTVAMLRDICHEGFLKTKFNGKLTVDNSLDIMMKSIIAGLEFSHSKTKCAVESHCYDWYNKQIIGLAKIKNWPRCEQESEGFLNCKLKGLQGQNCPVIEKNTRISDGQWEFSCDKGLRCVKYQNIVYANNSIEKFLYGNVKTFAKGKCMPMNARTYKDPMTLQNEREAKENNYIEINFQ